LGKEITRFGQMKKSKKIILLGEIFTIHYVTAKQIKKLANDNDEMQGYMNPAKKQILVVDDDDAENTLWHELGHYFGQVIIGEDNEAQANAFSTFVTTVLHQLGYKSKKWL
jgi:Zn-dependent peptidase ImmA (M78 family)